MVGDGMFNFLNLCLQQIMGTKEPFGRISLITVGDLFQLKPVFDKWIFENSNYSSYGSLANNLWKDYFALFELTEIMRQRDDKQFAELLNRLREGNHSKNDKADWKQRLLHLKPDELNYPMDLTHLFTTNSFVSAHNNNPYTLSKASKSQVKAIDIIVGYISDDLNKQMKEKIPHDPMKTMGLYSTVQIATNGKYDLRNNVDGAECIIKNIDYRVENSSRPSIVWVSFGDPYIGQKQEKESAHLYDKKNMQRNCTPILEVTRQFRINKKCQIEILR